MRGADRSHTRTLTDARHAPAHERVPGKQTLPMEPGAREPGWEIGFRLDRARIALGDLTAANHSGDARRSRLHAVRFDPEEYMPNSLRDQFLRTWGETVEVQQRNVDILLELIRRGGAR